MRKIIFSIVVSLLAAASARSQELGFAAYASDFGAQLESGFYGEYNPVAGDVPDTAHTWSHLLTVRHQNASNNYQMQIAGSYAVNDRLFFRKIAASGTSNPNWIEFATRGVNYFSGDQTVEGSVKVLGSTSFGVPAFAVNRTWGQNSAQAEDNRPFIIRRGDGDDQSLATYVQDAVLYFNYRNDESFSNIIFRMQNTDTESGGGANASDRNILILNSAQDGGRAYFDGNVAIGTDSTDHALNVAGTIRAEEVIVEAQPWADYVFEDGYDLKSLSEVASHIQEHGRLPGMPSAAQVSDSGVSLGDSQRLLLEKVEELTLHLIDLEKRLDEKDRQIEHLLNAVNNQ